MGKNINEQVSTNMEQNKEQPQITTPGAVETNGGANATASVKQTKKTSSKRKTENGDDVDPKLILNSFRSNDMSISPAARITENEEETSAKEEVAQSISESQAEEQKPTMKPKPTPVKAKGSSDVEAYINTYYKDAGISPKTGKTAYLCSEHHERIQKLIRVVGKGETTLFSYLYNIVEQHFVQQREVIEEAYKTNNSIY